jgi:hypothetical protein
MPSWWSAKSHADSSITPKIVVVGICNTMLVVPQTQGSRCRITPIRRRQIYTAT